MKRTMTRLAGAIDATPEPSFSCEACERIHLKPIAGRPLGTALWAYLAEHLVPHGPLVPLYASLYVPVACSDLISPYTGVPIREERNVSAPSRGDFRNSFPTPDQAWLEVFGKDGQDLWEYIRSPANPVIPSPSRPQDIKEGMVYMSHNLSLRVNKCLLAVVLCLTRRNGSGIPIQGIRGVSERWLGETPLSGVRRPFAEVQSEGADDESEVMR